MGAFHVVGQDFELGLGIGRGAAAEQQVAVELLRVGFLRVGPDHDAAEKDAVGAIIDHTLEQLARGAAGRRVIDEGRGGRLLLAAQQEGAGEAAGRPWPVEADLNVLARQARAERQAKPS